jgi:hypothetical protein
MMANAIRVTLLDSRLRGNDDAKVRVAPGMIVK